jgi:hypothetical protein
VLLAELTRGARRLALVGLAKNTGKTVTLNALLAELAAAGTVVGVTSVGRDGEQHDVIDFRIEKPRVHLVAGSFVATTDALLFASGIEHELLQRTGVGTPLGEVLVARTLAPGEIEIAGPSAAADARAVADTMLASGAEQALIDGAIDRRAASSPQVSDGLVMCTGAVLSGDIDEVVERTRAAVALVRLPLLASSDGAALELLPRFALTADAEAVAKLLGEHPDARVLLAEGALPESFVRSVAQHARRAGRELTVAVRDPTHAFLHERGPEHYAAQGVRITTLAPIELLALTVNPVAPQSHGFDSAELRARLADAIPDVPIFDVLHPEYTGAQPAGEDLLRASTAER